MGYLTLNDYIVGGSISSDNLEQILKQARNVTSDYDVLESTERRAISTVEDYISARYKCNEIFAQLKTFATGTTFTWNDRINFTADVYASATVYTSGQFVLYNGVVYEKNATVAGYVAGTLPTNATFFNNRGAEGIYYVTPPETFDEEVTYSVNDYVSFEFGIYQLSSIATAGTYPTETTYWTKIIKSEYATEYPVLGFYPNNTTYWTYGDNRNQSIVRTVCDISLYYLHAVINPRNIPALRADRYTQATGYLSELMKGTLNAVLPSQGAQKGYKIRFGSNEQYQTNW